MAKMNSQTGRAVAFILIFSGLSCAYGATDSTAVSPPSVISAVGARSFLLEQGQSSGYVYYNINWGGSNNIASSHSVCPSGYAPQLNLTPMSAWWSNGSMAAFHLLGNLTTSGSGSGAYYQVNITSASSDIVGGGGEGIFLTWQIMCNSTAP